MTRKSRREIENAIDDLDTADESDGLGELWVSWRDDEDEQPDNGPVIDFTEVET